MPGLPLEGVRVLDLTAFMAGPIATQLLGYLGAEVIKVESIQRMDFFRLNLVATQQEKVWERAPLWLATNVDKYGVTLNLSHTRGRALFLELVKAADVVMENFSPRVMKNWDLEYPVLREANPSIIMVSVSGFGKTGPWKDFVGFAHTFEQTSGIGGITGYPDGIPLTVLGSSDPLSAMHAAYATLLALEHRRRTGQGQYVEVVQLETLIGLLGREVMEYSINRRVEPRRGNRHPFMAPHGVYRCSGEDEWVAIAVASDEEFRRLCEAMGPDGVDPEDPRFQAAPARFNHQDELDALIERWTRTRSKREVMELLQSKGLIAGAVLTSPDLLGDPQLQERGFFQELDRELVGRASYPMWAFKSERLPRRHTRPAPMLGQHNEVILGDLLGLSPKALEELEEQQVIGKEPLGV